MGFSLSHTAEESLMHITWGLNEQAFTTREVSYLTGYTVRHIREYLIPRGQIGPVYKLPVRRQLLIPETSLTMFFGLKFGVEWIWSARFRDEAKTA
jgi:hypothetical protein